MIIQIILEVTLVFNWKEIKNEFVFLSSEKHVRVAVCKPKWRRQSCMEHLLIESLFKFMENLGRGMCACAFARAFMIILVNNFDFFLWSQTHYWQKDNIFCIRFAVFVNKKRGQDYLRKGDLVRSICTERNDRYPRGSGMGEMSAQRKEHITHRSRFAESKLPLRMFSAS